MTVIYTVATVLTVYGIETTLILPFTICISICCNSAYRLRYWNAWATNSENEKISKLQQCLPFTVLKLFICHWHVKWINWVATVLTVYGIETHVINHKIVYHGCNSAYRLRYWNLSELSQLHASISFLLQQYLSFTVLKLYTVFTQCNFYL